MTEPIAPIQPTTSRLWLRQWRDSDREPFAHMNSDAEVMNFFPGTLTRFQSDAWIDFVRFDIDRRGWGLWALQHLATGAFMGALGLHVVEFETPFTPAVEIGWRLARRYWHHGYATEAAAAALTAAFGPIGLDEVVAFTVPHNTASRAVMERLGMSLDAAAAFEHPRVDAGLHPDLVHHIVYRVTAAQWNEPTADR